jgi:hypothetical protein
VEGWSQIEVEATVADYLSMLKCEIRGEAYNKTEHRRALSRMLNGRSDAAIERKHQNISAILIALGLPYVDGYKPLGNYQQLLATVVQEHLRHSPALMSQVAEQVQKPAAAPSVDEILRALVAAPGSISGAGAPALPEIKERIFPDYLAREAENRSLGEAGEMFVMRYEQARLVAEGKDRLAASVEHVSRSRGDGAGYDILSFEPSGHERLIEVKTTSFGKYTPFYVSRNELAVSREQKDRYFLYRLFAFRTEAKLFHCRGALDQTFALEADQWIARP